ncbi:unnamed protein product [Phytophthora lilii]|uniref:Unnamed protein product n=1 Tax=Phytophthora lilii TaxID=2077276 RepID=A0A9W6TLS0_9STRA|nr:unnamed protein product [Phytophthora lilii]
MVLVTISYGYEGVYYGLYTSVSIFVYTMSYTTMLYALWCILVVETLHVANRLTARMEQAVDATLALFMLVAGVVLADSNDVSKCTIYGYVDVHCGTVKVAMAFAFIAMFFFLASLGHMLCQHPRSCTSRDGGSRSIPRRGHAASSAIVTDRKP